MSPQAGFLLQDQVVPRLRSAIPNCVHCVGSEDAQELIQDSIAMAAKLMDSLEQKGKQVTPGNIAYYTIQHIKSGRRSTGSSYADVMGTGTQLNGRSRLDSMEQVVAENQETGAEIFELHDILSTDQEDPGTQAARKIDWEQFMSGLSAREKAVIECLVDGRSLRAASKSFGLSDSTMQGTKRKLAIKIWEFMGFDILIDIQRRPQWKQNLEATREKMTCKHQRNH